MSKPIKLKMNQSKMPMNPFPGIRSFETNEQHLFFGREKQIGEILSVLTETHFLALIGYSGSGKSSLIRAGVIPAILNGKIEKKEDWAISFFSPGNRPITSLTLEYAKTYNKKANATGIKSMSFEKAGNIIRSNKNPLLKAYQKLTSGSWLIVIDQFEEIFRHYRKGSNSRSKDESQEFVNFFLDIINLKNIGIPVYIVLTMQSDFLDHCAEITGLTEAINKGYFVVPRMSASELHDAIVKPIEHSGGKISDTLVSRLAIELSDKPDQLPVMQHALMRAWDYWIENMIGEEPLDIRHYDAIGTISSALSIHAEEIYDGFRKEEQKRITEQLFKALTEPGIDKRGTLRPTPIQDLLKITGASKFDLFEVINEFRAPGRTFLIPPHNVDLSNETVIDISHESLIRVWMRLKEWREEETKSAEIYMRLSKSAELYQQGRAGLWTNPELEIAVKWKQKNKPNHYWAERYDLAFERAVEFLEYCKIESDFEIKNKEKKQKKELGRTKKIAVFLAFASIISILFLIISLNLRFQAEASEKNALEKETLAQVESVKAARQRKEAVAQKRIAEQQQFIAEQQKLITEEQRQFAILQQNIAIENEKRAKDSEGKAIEAQKEAKDAETVARISEQKARTSETSARESEQRAIESEKNSKRLRLISIARTMAIQSIEINKTGDVELPALLALQAYQFNKNNNGYENDPSIYNALSNIADLKPIFRDHKDAVRGIALSTDGSNLFSCSDDGTIRQWDLNSSNLFSTQLDINKTKNGFRCISLSNNGEFLVSGCTNGDIFFWDMTKENPEPVTINGHSKIVNKIIFDKSGKLFISISSDGTMKTWNTNSPETPFFTSQTNSKLISLALGENNKKLVCGDEKGIIRIYDLTNLTKGPVEFQTDKEPILALSLDKTNNKLAVGYSTGTIKLYSINDLSKKPNELIGHLSGINSICFSPDGNLLASCSYDKTIRIWNNNELEDQPIIINDSDSWVMDINFSVDGNKIFASGNDKTIRQWIIKPDVLAGKICKNIKRNFLLEEWNKYVGNDIEYTKTCPDL